MVSYNHRKGFYWEEVSNNEQWSLEDMILQDETNSIKFKGRKIKK